ncbi:hypothetical protein FJ414_06570 [Mesorhizobium sp. B3-1-6]|uniref:McrC family protein n=1 Tax=Mesorhizobium sp. B3-1-6 TaxID=2589895 RepID=UPI00112638BC|nr:hypothetical protein [Mesorhizobium sp. B3-1-6]TPI42106.1 hypothetical protein FJ414_06570 [Mesorhizobium sp. B3-1-6]
MISRQVFREWERPRTIQAEALSDSEQALARKLRESGRLSVSETRQGFEVATTSWVGRIVLGGVEISIQPKIKAAPLVQLLRYAFGLERLSLIGHVPFSTEAYAFQDILGQQLALEVARLIARGLHREYRVHKAELSSLRGRVLFDELARTQSSARAAIPCRYFERTEHNALNAALRAGLRLAAQLVASLDLAQELKRLSVLIEVGAQPLTRELLAGARAQVDRRSRHYEPLLDLIEILRDGAGVSMDDGERRLELPGFLFDMNRFFQALVSRLLNEHLEDCEVLDERRLQPMFRYASNVPRRNAPVLRPDFTIRSVQGRPRATLDAKYRDLWEMSLPAHMLYQLALYAQADSRRAAAIIYPSLQDRPDQEIRMSDPGTKEERARIYLRALDLENLRRQVETTPGAMQRRELAVIARRVAFGESAELRAPSHVVRMA